jgi:hypothetical protein
MFELKRVSTRTQRKSKDQRYFPSFSGSALGAGWGGDPYCVVAEG